jgi:hypothetical protein
VVAVSPHRPPNPDPPPDPDAAGPVAGLAREVDGLRRRLDTLDGLPERLDELAVTVTDLALKLDALTARRGPTPCPSWLLAPTHEPAITRQLGELVAWLEAVFLRYSDAALPECWLWHPDVVEELLWLSHAWLSAYQGPAASVALAADWHDRLRPGAVRRIKAQAGSCSRERHQTRPGRDRLTTGIPQVPGAEAVAVIAAWWGPHRDQDAPEPATRHPDNHDHDGGLLPTTLTGSRSR